MRTLAWLEGLPISRWVQESNWGHPILLCFHAVGMAMVVGAVLVMTLRVLGFFRGLSSFGLSQLLGVAWIGFALNAGSGTLIYMSNATQLSTNWTFLLKIALIALGGVSVWGMNRLVPEAIAPTTRFSTGAKLLASLALVFWITAIFSGRYIAYTLQPPGF